MSLLLGKIHLLDNAYMHISKYPHIVFSQHLKFECMATRAMTCAGMARCLLHVHTLCSLKISEGEIMEAKIGDLIREARKPFFSLEFFPPANEEDLPRFYQVVDALGKYRPLFVSVTYGAGGAKQQNTLKITAGLAKRAYVTMAHLTCVGAGREKILDFLDSLLQNGVANILALRGDPPKDSDWDWNCGAFRHADDLVRMIHHERPQMGIGVAAYPTPHPDARSFMEDRDYTAQKIRAGADFAITQLFFDPREYDELRAYLNKQGIFAPIVPGIITIQSFQGLKRVLSLCGVNIPAKLYISLEDAHERGGQEALREAGIKFTLAQIRQLREMGAPGFHLFTLNRADLCSRIIEEAGLAGNSE